MLYLYYIDSSTSYGSRLRRWLTANPKTGAVESKLASANVPAVSLDSKEGAILEALRKANPDVKRRRSQRTAVTCRRRAARAHGYALGKVAMAKTNLEELAKLGHLVPTELATALTILWTALDRIEEKAHDYSND